MEGLGWHFPPTNGGREDGYVDPGMEYFRGSPLACLARETIQNSLDAQSIATEPVSVVFEVKATTSPNDLGRGELRRHVEACLDEHELTNNPKAHQEFARAAGLLSDSNIVFLRVADYNTTGLDDRHWDALVKKQGSSEKSSQSAGGSFGIGKYAPFVVSQLRTVFYWSRYEAAESVLEYCQGKAVLLSHNSPGGRKTQGTGYFGHRDGCRQMQGRQIPTSISAVEGTRDASGTSIWIAGFADHADWRMRVASSVVSNFFCAIADGQLKVLIEPEYAESVFEHWDIKRDNLATTFRGLLQAEVPDKDDEDSTRLKDAFAFYTAMCSDKGVLKEREDTDLGHCRLWIHVEDGLPSKVGLVRKTGMLITAEQRGLLRFPGLQDFAAVLRFESDRGNIMLRDMENTQHSQFEPDRLSPDEQSRGRRALNRVIKWIRDEIKALATPVVADTSEEVSELAHLLPDIEPDESFGERNDGEPGFGGSDFIALKPTRRIRNADLDEEDGDDAGGRQGTGRGLFDAGRRRYRRRWRSRRRRTHGRWRHCRWRSSATGDCTEGCPAVTGQSTEFSTVVPHRFYAYGERRERKNRGGGGRGFHGDQAYRFDRCNGH